MVLKQEEIAKQFIHELMKVKAEQNVLIHVEIAESNQSKELSLAEELVYQCRAVGAYPILSIDTAVLKQKMWQQLHPEFVIPYLPYYPGWQDTADLIIDFTWKNNPSLVYELPDYLQEQIKDWQTNLFQTVFQTRKRVLLLHYPYESISHYYQLSHEALERVFYSSLRCNIYRMQVYAQKLMVELSKVNSVNLKNESGDLKFSLHKELTPSFIGDFEQQPVVLLPTGRLEFALDRDSLDGVLTFDRVYYLQYCFESVKIKFESGSAKALTLPSEKTEYQLIRQALADHELSAQFSLGLNYRQHEFCGYYLYDQNMLGCYCLKLMDQFGNPIYLMTEKGELASGRRSAFTRLLQPLFSEQTQAILDEEDQTK